MIELSLENIFIKKLINKYNIHNKMREQFNEDHMYIDILKFKLI